MRDDESFCVVNFCLPFDLCCELLSSELCLITAPPPLPQNFFFLNVSLRSRFFLKTGTALFKMFTAWEGERPAGDLGIHAEAFARGLSLFQLCQPSLSRADVFAQASWVNMGLAGPNLAEDVKATWVPPGPVCAML